MSPLPLPLPTPPVKPRSRSGRLRQRFRSRKQVWRAGLGLFGLVNSVHAGNVDTTKCPQRDHLSAEVLRAVKLAGQHLMREAATFVRDRRGFPTGDHQSRSTVHKSVARRFDDELRSLVKNIVHDDCGYAKRGGGPVQVPIIADRMAEPSEADGAVSMLEALPPLEAAFYAKEEKM